MTWTNDPPTEPGKYTLRFKAADGIDQTPLEIVTEWSPFHPGELCVQDRWEQWHRLGALYGASVEWWWKTD